MNEARLRLKSLMGSLGTTQAELARYINGSPAIPYQVLREEVRDALSGASTAPKDGRIVADGIAHLERIQRRLIGGGDCPWTCRSA